jgi:FtsZ-binding cell division protein ZapB
MAFLPLDTLRHWKEKAAELREQWCGVREQNERLRRENDRLRQEREQWEQERGRLERERERLRQENEKLKKQLEEAQRAAKRQAAPSLKLPTLLLSRKDMGDCTERVMKRVSPLAFRACLRVVTIAALHSNQFLHSVVNLLADCAYCLDRLSFGSANQLLSIRGRVGSASCCT